MTQASSSKDVSDLTGLTTDEALRQLKLCGPNAMPDVTLHPLRMALDKFWAPVPWMLEAAILLEVVLGKYVEASVMATLLVFNAVLGYFQEGRAEATLAALKKRLALNATVKRDNVWTIVPAANLVVGDIVKLSLGSVVAADVSLIDGSVLLDQSMLTGESVPIEAGTGFNTYAGALVRRGEAVARVTATGARTKFGRTAELVRTAHVESTQQKAVLRIVRNLALFNSVIVLSLIAYAQFLKMPISEIIPLALTAILASIPVALPATFTLAAAFGARFLAKLHVLPTRLSAVDEAGSIDLLCSDKTGTLTQNELSLTAFHAMPGYDEPHVLSLAALASSNSGQDPIDVAIRVAAAKATVSNLPTLVKFIPFDPTTKISEASALEADGTMLRIVKGAFTAVAGLTQTAADSLQIAQDYETQGFRVLAVAIGPPTALKLSAIIAFSDPPRPDSAELITELHTLGVRVIMVTGDAPTTASIVAHEIGLNGKVCPPRPIPANLHIDEFAVFASILPEGKYNLVKAFQKAGHTVGMCGDGANDAPALRQAQMGIAVSTATDVAKSAAGIVLTMPGLGGIVASVKEGRTTYQRILTYTLNSITKKIAQMLLLAAGLIMTGQAILTPMLMVILMITGDFLSMSLTIDNVRPSPLPNSWPIGRLTLAGVIIGVCDLFFCLSIFAFGKYHLLLSIGALRTLALISLAFGSIATLYAIRDRRRMWGLYPSIWVIVSSMGEILIISSLAIQGIAMSALPSLLIGETLLAAVIYSFILNMVKVPLFHRLKIA